MESKFIEIKFEYQDNIVTIKKEPYCTIKEVKEKAIKRFHGIPKDIHCFYLQRDLISYENTSIGEFFNNREKVTLKLMPEKKPIFPTKKKSNEKNDEELFHDLYLNTNVYSSGFNNIGRFINKKKNTSNSIDLNYKKYKITEKLRLPPIKTQSMGKNENSANDINSDDIDEEKNINCKNCGNNKFTEYCRNCKEFVCSYCKKKDKHLDHLFIHLDSNYKSNIKIYGNILLTDMEYFKANNDTITKDINHTSLLNIKQINDKHKILIDKLQKIIEKYENIINQIKNELLYEGENIIKDLASIYNSNSLKVKSEINELLKQLENNKEELKMKEFRNYFKEMSQNEDKLNNINKNKIQFQLTSEINNKINNMLNKIEQIINDTMQDNKNPFNLSPNINKELENILNKVKMEKSQNNEDKKRVNRKSKTSELNGKIT